MSFLAPTTALLAAAIVLPLLVAMYLLKLRRRPLRVSSILFWEKRGSDVQVNVPLARPRLSWLLLLHLLIATLLIAAVGRPALPGAAGTSGRVIVVIDHSASMNALDGKAGDIRDPSSDGSPADGRFSRLAEAKSLAIRAIRDATANSALTSVVAVAAGTRVLREFSSDRTQAIQSIAELQPTDQPGNLASCTDVLRALVASAGDAESGPSVEILLFSDGVFSGIEDPSAIAGVPLRLVRVGSDPAAAKPNLGIVALAARRIESDMQGVEVFARVQNSANEPRVVPVSFALSGRVLETRSVTVPSSVGDVPGEASLTFSCRPDARTVATVSLGVDAAKDLLANDNSASLVLRRYNPPRILFVTRGAMATSSTAESSPLSASFLLGDVLEELRAGELKRVTAGEYDEVASTGQLKFFDAIVFDNVTPRQLPPIPSISFGSGLPSPGLELGPPSEAGPAKPVLSWSRSHPLLQFITLDGVVVSRSRPARENSPTVTPIARGDTGPLILTRDIDAEPRRIVCSFDLADSNWPIEPGFAIFMNASVAWLTASGAGDAARAFTTVEPVSVDRGDAPAPIRYERVGSTPAEIIQASGPGTRALLGVLERAGVYVPSIPGETDARRRDPEPAAVNLLDPLESAIGTSDSLRVGKGRVLSTSPNPTPLEIWWWFLVAAGAMLVLEWFVFARSARS
ncbi:MAG: VWA domain-containing protein [Phycisphaerales bacterium]|nr:VWA domain-containing protein [Phycisphaerales bacterium]